MCKQNVPGTEFIVGLKCLVRRAFFASASWHRRLEKWP